MATVDTNFSALVNSAIDRLGPLQKRVMKRRIANRPGYFEMICDELLLKCQEEEPLLVKECEIDSSKVVQFDPETFKKLVEMLLKYLPLILKLFM